LLDGTLARVVGVGRLPGEARLTPTAIATARTLPPTRIPTICVPVIPGNSTDTVRIKDSITRTAITAPVNRLRPRVFTQDPSTAVSLQSSSRNTVALGSKTPAKV
jgi:hypothetical protein